LRAAPAQARSDSFDPPHTAISLWQEPVDHIWESPVNHLWPRTTSTVGVAELDATQSASAWLKVSFPGELAHLVCIPARKRLAIDVSEHSEPAERDCVRQEHKSREDAGIPWLSSRSQLREGRHDDHANVSR
jgi:hypothetical protein